MMPKSILVASHAATIAADLAAILSPRCASLLSTPLEELGRALRACSPDVLAIDPRGAAPEAFQLALLSATGAAPALVLLVGAPASEAANAILSRRRRVIVLPEPFPESQAELDRLLRSVLEAPSNAPPPARRAQAVDSIIQDSPHMARVREQIMLVAASTGATLIQGESGTGKELIARAIHDQSARRDLPFISINCAAIPEGSIENELFGHVRGASPEALQERTGLLVEAGQGTVFLDQVGDLSPAMQARLLRVIEERCVRPSGGDQEVPFQARILAATPRDLMRDVRAGRFRSDLFFRLSVFEISVPPLRERGNDVLLIAERMIETLCALRGMTPPSLAKAAADKLLAYPWPGNVRELEHCLEHAVLSAGESETLLPAHLPRRITAPPAFRSQDGLTAPLSLDEVERQHVMHVLRVVGGNHTEAARILNVDRTTLYRKLARYRERKA